MKKLASTNCNRSTRPRTVNPRRLATVAGIDDGGLAHVTGSGDCQVAVPFGVAHSLPSPWLTLALSHTRNLRNCRPSLRDAGSFERRLTQSPYDSFGVEVARRIKGPASEMSDMTPGRIEAPCLLVSYLRCIDRCSRSTRMRKSGR